MHFTSSNVSSPVNSTSVTIGVNNHTSTVALVYGENTFPTPWPVLVLGLTISFATSVWGIYSQYRLYRDVKDRKRLFERSGRLLPPRPLELGSTLVTTVSMAVSTIRASSAFIQAVKAMKGGSGRFTSGSTILTINLSLIPYMYQVSDPDASIVASAFALGVRFLALADFILAVGAGAMMDVAFLRPSEPYYSKWYQTGGNCPIFVGSCPALPIVGCGLNDSTLAGASGLPLDDPNMLNGANYLRYEGYIEAILFWIIMGLVVIFLLSVFYSAARGAARGESPWQQTTSQAPNQEEEKTPHEKFIDELLGSILGKVLNPPTILVTAAITITLHCLQEMRPKSIAVVDSFGPLRNASTLVANSTSWSDCFMVHPPADHYGFLSFWWQKYQDRLETLLALN